jgi:hypothetical protein
MDSVSADKQSFPPSVPSPAPTVKRDPIPVSPEDSNTWNDIIEDDVKAYGNASRAYKWMHIKTARSLSSWHTRLIILAIILSYSVSAAMALDLIIKTDFALRIIVIAFGAVAGTLTTIIKVKKFEEAIQDNKTAAARHVSVVSNVRRQLVLPRNMRDPAPEYLSYISNAHDQTYESCPLIEAHIFNKYKKYAQTRNLKIPDEYDEIVDNYIDEICNDKNIEVNRSDKEITEEQHSEESSEKGEIRIKIDGEYSLEDRMHSSNGHENPRPLLKGSSKNSSRFNVGIDYNRFNDGNQRYEMRRMFGWK